MTDINTKKSPQPVRYEKGWMVDFYYPPQVRRRKQFPFSEHGESPDAAIAWIKAVLSGEDTAPSKNEIAVRIREYLSWKEKIKGVARETLRADSQRLSRFSQWCDSQSIRSLSLVSIKTIRSFNEYYLMNAPFTNERHRTTARHNPRATWQKYRQVLSAFFIWAMKRDFMSENPAADEEFKERIESKVPEIFTIAELDQLFAYFDMRDSNQKHPWVAAAFRFLAYTGCRPGEFWNLRWEHVDLEGRVIRFTDTKTKRDRIVPISEKLLPYLETLPRGNGLVWDNGRGDYLYQESGWWKILDTAMTKCGIKTDGMPRNLYTFRHTFCANLCLAGVPITVVKTIMGHSSILTTMRYAEHFYRDDRKAAVDRLPY